MDGPPFKFYCLCEDKGTAGDIAKAHANRRAREYMDKWPLRIFGRVFWIPRLRRWKSAKITDKSFIGGTQIVRTAEDGTRLLQYTFEIEEGKAPSENAEG